MDRGRGEIHKILFRPGKSNNKKKSICKLVNNGVALYDQTDISKHVVDFYQHLFRSTYPNKANMSEYITSAETRVTYYRQ